MEFISFIGVVIILVVVSNLRGRVQTLEKYVKSGAPQHIPTQGNPIHPKQLVSQQPVSPSPLHEYITQRLQQGASREDIAHSLMANGWQGADVERALHAVLPSAQFGKPVATHPLSGPTLIDTFVAWLKEDWLMKLGALLLLIGFGWLASYAFLNNWIGPMGRIALGLVAGALFMVLGFWRIRKYLSQGSIFLVLGSTIILLTIFAAREIYDFFTPLTGLSVMFLSTAFVALASVKYNSRALAFVSLLLAGIAPLLTNAPTTNYVGLFAYLLIVILGAIWIVVLTGKRELTLAALLLVTFYSFPHFFSTTIADRGILLFFVYAFVAVFFLTNTIGILKSKDKDIFPDLVTAACNGLFLLVWIMVAAQDEWKSMILVAWIVVFAVGAYLVFRSTHRREPFYIYVCVCIALLAAATSAELQGATLTIAYTLESGIIALVAFSVFRDTKIVERTSLLLVGPVLLSFASFTAPTWVTSVLNKDFFVLLILSVTFFGLGFVFSRSVRNTEERKLKQLSTVLYIVGSMYAYVLLWLSLHAALTNDNSAVMIALVVYIIIGLVCYFSGLTRNRKVLRLYGSVLIGFVVGRLLLVDIWKMELAIRIVLFFLIGALLVSTAFLGKKENGSRNNTL